ncbi:Alpha-glucosidase [Acidisarcina polymorpha]|uniref:Xylan alpha-1,2-glucuronidase n=1 Tax=Acidisarcina polymorpha TaxID=2211140 RepID=A0A2Z5G172_9BACT|nr:alpha-glucuronidase family glycosyl hydrolase [Acidisarcina polymorpha]AXC12534.1 Alpha-glucosidase [Acidisarcina polymorpha]
MRLFVRLSALAILLTGCGVWAEDGSAAWLRYAPVEAAKYEGVPSRIVVLGNSVVERAAGAELAKGLSAMLARPFTWSVQPFQFGAASTNAILLGSYRSLGDHTMDEASSSMPGTDRYSIRFSRQRGSHRVLIAGSSPQAELYGAFHLLEEIGADRVIPEHETQVASAAIRWTDEWDNLDGTIERGYAGPSFFFKDGHVLQDLTRASDYARLLSSVGINGCNVNNVNADLDLLSSEHLREYARIADAFRPWGVKLALSVDLTAPQIVGGLPSFDPLDPTVVAWWKQKVDEIYTLIPDFGGFTVKADSEGRLGPSKYGRSPADAANVLARALAPHGGVVLYRGFVYNNHLDWRDPKADRARAGVDNFVRFDGQFDSNVVIQIKEGPIDFQAREPVSPLFAALRQTNMAIELQTSQEYTGQQRHMIWLPSMWKWVLDTDLQADNRHTPVKQIVEGRSFPRPDGKSRLGGFISVTNAGAEANWLHHPMAMANLYGFGKLAWNPDEPLSSIIDTWTRLTWGNDPRVDQVIDALQLHSWQVYEGYTGPNGMGTLTNILGYHFGPGIESAERNGWGQWFRGEKDGIGMDRTAAGTGFAQQYPPSLAAKYDSIESCPENLLLFFHHVPYDHRLRSGKTLVQSIYDTHYLSARAAGEYVPQWMTLKGLVDDDRYQLVLRLFTFQAGHAIVWRDAIDDWFYWRSQIADVHGRVGNHSGRIEAETMATEGYQPVEVTPWETASGGKAVVCRLNSGCSLSAVITQPAGRYNVAVQYFDLWRGISNYQLLVNGKGVSRWAGDDTLPPAQFDPHLDGQTSTRFTVQDVWLKPGDTLMLKGTPDLRDDLNRSSKEAASPGAIEAHTLEQRDYRELAPVDYIQLGPNGAMTPQE